ncbi:DUF480 domain-containing protein [Calycomorphotria hydatis]|uniref:DUF480 domain-containing protein n=1 Tax=Calycomorphotria hydatis TaxID=2528027 RepID=A0A517TDZ3_9PLAN|nr:DUF480 domain-containing protein [Calycomorphotria hydatis]QDT66593.1 hypothetical protein V22_38630 [Calycomorphotria hydatis]
MEQANESEETPIRELKRAHRRILGTLSEKAFTTGSQYPLTLKALVTGCNQTSNRSPVTNYSEDQVTAAIDELAEMGLMAIVYPESGRTERYRHYLRKKFPFSEPQLAVMTELLLRGRQTLGELRGRASRMVPIDSLEDLRREVTGLIEQGYVEASDQLERRGVEVDHALYTDGEQPRANTPRTVATTVEVDSAPVSAGASAEEIDELRVESSKLAQQVEALTEKVTSLSQQVEVLSGELQAIRNELGG